MKSRVGGNGKMNKDNTKGNAIADKHDETRKRLVFKLLPYVRKNGIQSLRMDEIAKMMEVSRATLYKYFSTKEEIMGYVVNSFVEYINEMMEDSLDTDQRFGLRFQQLFEQSVLSVVYITEVFVKELENSYPEHFDRLQEAMKQREQQVLAFYEEGIAKGIFHEVNPKLLIRQDELLRSLLEVKYLMENQVTVSQVLHDYYTLKKVQLFTQEKMNAVDDTLIAAKIEHLAHKIAKNLY